MARQVAGSQGSGNSIIIILSQSSIPNYYRMPELPEVETIKRGLEKKILGKVINRVEVRLPKIVAFGPRSVSNIRIASRQAAQKFARLLRGLKIEHISRRAKMLVFDLSKDKVRSQPPLPARLASRPPCFATRSGQVGAASRLRRHQTCRASDSFLKTEQLPGCFENVAVKSGSLC